MLTICTYDLLSACEVALDAEVLINSTVQNMMWNAGQHLYNLALEAARSRHERPSCTVQHDGQK